MKYYFKKTWCGMVLMVLHEWEDDGMPMGQYRKATEVETCEFMQSLMARSNMDK